MKIEFNIDWETSYPINCAQGVLSAEIWLEPA